jgi:hypothetical protein
MLIHVFNGYSKDVKLNSLKIDGNLVSASTPSLPLTLPSQQTVMFDIPLPRKKGPAEVWTLELDSNVLLFPIGLGGRHIREYFPVEVWPKSFECVRSIIFSSSFFEFF